MTSSHEFPRSAPEAQGISSSEISRFVDALEATERPLEGVHSMMLLRHGNVIAEGWWSPYQANANHMMFSVSKSYCSTAIGLAVAEGLLSVDDQVLAFFPDEAPADPSPNIQAMRVRHLLSMNTGHHEDTTGAVFAAGDESWARVFLSLPVEHEPGTWFVYNTGATYMLSAIITRLTGESLLEYLRPRLFEPLGITHPTWDTDPRGISIGGSGLHIRTEDIARLGQLYLQDGRWGETELLAPAWVAEATSVHSDNSNTQTNPDWTVGYGYQFWRCRHNAYRGDGAFGQFCLVMPDQNAVLAITSGLMDMQAVLDKVWDILLPAFEEVVLPADPAAARALQDKLESLVMRQPVSSGRHADPETWSGKRWVLNANPLGVDSVALTPRDGDVVVSLEGQAGDQEVLAGTGTWQTGAIRLPDPRSGLIDLTRDAGEPVAASGAWSAPNTYDLWLAFTNGVYGQAWRFDMDGDRLTLTIEPNVSWGDGAPLIVEGHLDT